MIPRERLKELIENNGTIYCVGDNVYKITLDKRYFCILGNYLQWSKFLDKPMLQRTPHIDDIYETKEDADFVKEFKGVKHTETLDLPLFDDLLENFDISFVRFDKELDCWVIYELYVEFNEICILFRDITEEASDCIFREPLTKENYLEACKIAKKLFLGEKWND